jgi:hypothetical protein
MKYTEIELIVKEAKKLRLNCELVICNDRLTWHLGSGYSNIKLNKVVSIMEKFGYHQFDYTICASSWSINKSKEIIIIGKGI